MGVALWRISKMERHQTAGNKLVTGGLPPLRQVGSADITAVS
jgi:hypothetical protein